MRDLPPNMTDYLATRSTFRLEVPEVYNYARDVVLGCIKLGAVPMPGTTLLTARDIDYRLERAGARVAVTDPGGADKVDQAAKRMGVHLTRILVRSQEAGGPPAAGRPGRTAWSPPATSRPRSSPPNRTTPCSCTSSPARSRKPMLV